MKKILPIVALAAVASVVPALLTGNPLAAVKFALAFTGIFVLPLAPWVAMLDRHPLEQMTLAIIMGIPAAAITFFVIGVLKGPLSWTVFVAVPVIIFAVGAWQLSKRKS